jgi:hypothetical protein
VRGAASQDGERLLQPVAGVGGPERRHHQDRRRDQLLDHADEQRQRLGVGAVQVVQDDRQRPRPGRGAQPGADRAVQAEPARGRVGRRRRRLLLLQQRGQRTGELGGRDPPGERAQRLHPGPGRRRALGLGAPPDRDQPAVGLQPPAHPGQQARLADTRLTGHQHDLRSAAADGAGGRLQGGELGPAPDEHLARRARRRTGRGSGDILVATPQRRLQHLHPLGEDGALQLDQRRPGVQAQLRGEVAAGTPQRREGVALPAAAPQRERQQAPALLPQRLLAREDLRGRHGLGRRPGPQHHLDEQLGGGQAQLLQPGRLRDRPGLVADLGIRRALPQPERLLQQGACLRRAGPAELAGLPQQPPEAPGVHHLVGGPDRVARRRADQQPRGRAWGATGLEHPPQVGHVGLQRRGGARRRLATPQVVDQAVGRHDLAPGRPAAPPARHAAAGRRGPPAARRARPRSARAPVSAACRPIVGAHPRPGPDADKSIPSGPQAPRPNLAARPRHEPEEEFHMGGGW